MDDETRRTRALWLGLGVLTVGLAVANLMLAPRGAAEYGVSCSACHDGLLVPVATADR